MKYLKLMRIKHYIKNGLIFAPLVFSGYLFDSSFILPTLLGFLSFSLIASIVYIINDINDVELDRIHPTKRHRPIANGSVSVGNAKALAIILFLLSMITNYAASGLNSYSWIYLLGYFIINFSYSVGLKNYAIIDIAILVSGFVIRVFYGSSLTDITISNWLYLTIIAMSFYLGLGKRRNELMRQKQTSRKVLQHYNQSFLDKNMYVCLALTITFYSLWTVDPITTTRINGDNLIWTVPLVILICMKYSLNIEKESDGDPVEVLLGDKLLLLLVTSFSLLTLIFIYFV